MHIGLIGGIGPAATDFYHRGLMGALGSSVELTIVHADNAVLVENLLAGRPEAQAEVYRHLTERLKAAGADCVAITSGGGHFCIDAFLPISPLRVMNVLDLVPQKILDRGIRRLGIMGTTVVMETGLYGRLGAVGIDTLAPENADAVSAAYLAMAGRGKVRPDEVAIFDAAGHALVERGADAVLLGGTDLFLAYEDRDPGFPVLDLAALHIEALAESAG